MKAGSDALLGATTAASKLRRVAGRSGRAGAVTGVAGNPWCPGSAAAASASDAGAPLLAAGNDLGAAGSRISAGKWRSCQPRSSCSMRPVRVTSKAGFSLLDQVTQPGKHYC